MGLLLRASPYEPCSSSSPTAEDMPRDIIDNASPVDRDMYQHAFNLTTQAERLCASSTHLRRSPAMTPAGPRRATPRRALRKAERNLGRRIRFR